MASCAASPFSESTPPLYLDHPVRIDTRVAGEPQYRFPAAGNLRNRLHQIGQIPDIGAVAVELVDGIEQETAVAREVLTVGDQAPAGDDRRDVVVAEIAVHELVQLMAGPERHLGAGRSEYEEINVPIGVGVGLDVGLGVERQVLAPLDRQAHGREGRDRLRPAVLEHLEVVASEAGDRLVVFVGDVDVHFDGFDARAEDGVGPSGAPRWRIRLREKRGTDEERHRGTEAQRKSIPSCPS